MEWLDTYMTSLVWFPEDVTTIKPAKIIILFHDDDVEGSVFWTEQFVEPCSFFL